jgi:hypothetical protein
VRVLLSQRWQTADSYRKPISGKTHDEFKNIGRRNAMMLALD